MNMLEVKDLTKSFGGLTAVNRVSLEIRTGEILGLIGPNGAGKTTFFSLISGFLSPDSGTVIFLGESILGLKPHLICRRGLSRTFQIVKPFANLTVAENVTAGAFHRLTNRDEAMEKSRQVMKLVGLADKAEQPARTLNIGQLKRLEIARALATEPKLLLLDEVMAGINDAEREQLLRVIQQVRDSGVTIMIIGHEIQAVLKVSDRLIVINFGEKIAEGRPDDVICRPDVVEAYLGEGYDLVGA